MLSAEQLEEYKTNGCLVIPNILTDAEVLHARHQFHEQLRTMGINHNKILSREMEHTEGPRIKSKVARIFYAKWKLLDVMLHPNVCRAFEEIMQATYQSNQITNFTHPFGASTRNYVFVDRVCWRLPDEIRAEGGLGLHLDQNPFDPYSNTTTFRPIQGFVALTDHYTSDAGGIKVVKKFHTEITEYFKKSADETKSNGGGFYRMNSKVHAKLAKRCEPLFMPKGSLCLWDNRLPHQTSDTLTGHDTREVVYCSFLPNVDINNLYIAKQLQSLRRNIPPPIYFDTNDKQEISDKNWHEGELTSMQKHFLGIE